MVKDEGTLMLARYSIKIGK